MTPLVSFSTSILYRIQCTVQCQDRIGKGLGKDRDKIGIQDQMGTGKQRLRLERMGNSTCEPPLYKLLLIFSDTPSTQADATCLSKLNSS